MGSIVSLFASTTRKIRILENMKLCSVFDELDKLSPDPEDGSEGETGDEQEQEEQESAAAKSQVTSNGSREGRSLDAKYKEMWEGRKLLLVATVFPMSHEETTSTMHCFTQTRTNTMQGGCKAPSMHRSTVP